jgi:methyltransferase (TIGR00027 family)
MSDTARWMAYVRAVESDRPDALFHDTYARELAGPSGEALAREIGDLEMVSGTMAVRTALLDRLIVEIVNRESVDLVLNIGSGFDTRPWRLPLPRNLQWLDVDLPGILNHKREIMSTRRTACGYESLPADIRDDAERAAAVGAFPAARRVLVVTEALLVCLKPSQVRALAEDLWKRPSGEWWLTDLIGPRVLLLLRQIWAVKLRAHMFQFAPTDSVEFFGSLGWREHSFHSSQEEAQRLNRAPHSSLLGRLMLMVSTPTAREEFRRLSGVALLARDTVTQSVLPGQRG